MTKRLLILGCGGHGRVVADTAFVCGYDQIAFLDDAHASLAPHAPFPVLGPMAMLEELTREWPAAMAAVGNNAARLSLFERLRGSGYEVSSVIHPSAVISRNASVGRGVFAAPGVIVNVGAVIGDAVILNTGTRIDHDCVIGAGSHIAPGTTLSGAVRVGIRVWLGTGCSVRQSVAIGDDAVVGVGAAVVADLPGSATYSGVPARLLAITK